MTPSLWLLSITAVSIAFIHTVIGPDHYIPFIMMANAQQWPRRKTLFVTFLCGIGHVLSSVILGMIGIAFGVALHKLQFVESVRNDIIAWAFIAFGMIYGLWGLKVAFRRKTHTHIHVHDDGSVHEHQHSHLFGPSHSHALSTHKVMTTWTLFTIFVLGPCEPLIPLLMLPAASSSVFGIVFVSLIFGIVTISTMTAMVVLVLSGMDHLPLKQIERFTHALAGGVIMITGFTMVFFGL